MLCTHVHYTYKYTQGQSSAECCLQNPLGLNLLSKAWLKHIVLTVLHTMWSSRAIFLYCTMAFFTTICSSVCFFVQTLQICHTASLNNKVKLMFSSVSVFEARQMKNLEAYFHPKGKTSKYNNNKIINIKLWIKVTFMIYKVTLWDLNWQLTLRKTRPP